MLGIVRTVLNSTCWICSENRVYDIDGQVIPKTITAVDLRLNVSLQQREQKYYTNHSWAKAQLENVHLVTRNVIFWYFWQFCKSGISQTPHRMVRIHLESRKNSAKSRKVGMTVDKWKGLFYVKLPRFTFYTFYTCLW